MNEEEFFAEEIQSQTEPIVEIDYDDYPEFDSLEYTTDW
jgi:hypothetical protein